MAVVSNNARGEEVKVSSNTAGGKEPTNAELIEMLVAAGKDESEVKNLKKAELQALLAETGTTPATEE